MRWFTHLSLGILLALLFARILGVTNLLALLLILAASLLPDIDEPKSLVGRHVRILGWAFRHRGFFHSLVALVLFSLLVLGIFQRWNYAFAFALAFLGHLLLDALTKQGVVLFPFGRVRGFARTGSFFEYVVLVCILLAIAVLFAITF